MHGSGFAVLGRSKIFSCLAMLAQWLGHLTVECEDAGAIGDCVSVDVKRKQPMYSAISVHIQELSMVKIILQASTTASIIVWSHFWVLNPIYHTILFIYLTILQTSPGVQAGVGKRTWTKPQIQKQGRLLKLCIHTFTVWSILWGILWLIWNIMSTEMEKARSNTIFYILLLIKKETAWIFHVCNMQMCFYFSVRWTLLRKDEILFCVVILQGLALPWWQQPYHGLRDSLPLVCFCILLL